MTDLNNNGKDDVQEIADGVKSFIAQEGVLLAGAINNALDWLKGELDGIPDAAQQLLKNAISTAAGDGKRPVGEVVADTLTILFNDTHDLIQGVEAEVVTAAQAVKSSVIEAVAGLTIQAPTS